MHNLLIAVAIAKHEEMSMHPNQSEWVKIHAIDGWIYDAKLAHGAAIYQDKSMEFDVYKDAAMALFDHDRECIRKGMNDFGDAAGMRVERFYIHPLSMFVVLLMILIFCLIL